jgi:alpha-N-acetylglucosaminidase
MKRSVVNSTVPVLLVMLAVCFILWLRRGSELKEASGVIERVLPVYADRFSLKLIGKEGPEDHFEIEPGKRKIIIRGSSGVAICSGFNYYLNNYCHLMYNFRTGSNMVLKGDLPMDFEKVRKVSPYQYRYMFNYCTFSYSMAFWDWEQWEKMIDWMALNGINMPLAPMGQEIIWQRVYKKYGLDNEDLRDFFVGPAYNAFGRMGCADGYGGPLPQSWIDNECILQKKILRRERRLGMTPVLQGFTGHVPSAFAEKHPDIKVSKLTWMGFSRTYLLDWEEPVFTEIGRDFITELKKEYGTDHLYAIDQFIEMEPVADTAVLRNMSNRVFSGIDRADPKGKWVLQTWPFATNTDFWDNDLTKAYLSGVPDDRLIALELHGEQWRFTGWPAYEGWYGKPWIWCVLSNFGDRTSMFGGLSQASENLEKVLSDPESGNLTGLGLINEGLDYNPAIYEYVTDMIWEKELPDLDKWKENYLLARYGTINEEILDAWTNIFNYYYTKERVFEKSGVNSRPQLVEKDIWPSQQSVAGIASLLKVSDVLNDVDAYQFDVVNLLRQVLGQYAWHLLFNITEAYKERNPADFDESVNRFMELSDNIEILLTTREEFLLGKWIGDSRERATNDQEEKLYEWNAKELITSIWHLPRAYGYALKDWSGMYSSYYLPRWEKFFAIMRAGLTDGEKLNYDAFTAEILKWEDDWIELREKDLNPVPSGNSIEVAEDLWNIYGPTLLSRVNDQTAGR